MRHDQLIQVKHRLPMMRGAMLVQVLKNSRAEPMQGTAAAGVSVMISTAELEQLCCASTTDQDPTGVCILQTACATSTPLQASILDRLMSWRH